MSLKADGPSGSAPDAVVVDDDAVPATVVDGVSADVVVGAESLVRSVFAHAATISASASKPARCLPVTADTTENEQPAF